MCIVYVSAYVYMHACTYPYTHTQPLYNLSKYDDFNNSIPSWDTHLTDYYYVQSLPSLRNLAHLSSEPRQRSNMAGERRFVSWRQHCPSWHNPSRESSELLLRWQPAPWPSLNSAVVSRGILGSPVISPYDGLRMISRIMFWFSRN